MPTDSESLIKAHKPGHIDIGELHHLLILRLCRRRPNQTRTHSTKESATKSCAYFVGQSSYHPCQTKSSDWAPTCCCTSSTGSARRQWFRFPSRGAAFYPKYNQTIMHSKRRHFNQLSPIRKQCPKKIKDSTCTTTKKTWADCLDLWRSMPTSSKASLMTPNLMRWSSGASVWCMSNGIGRKKQIKAQTAPGTTILNQEKCSSH